MRTSTAKSRLAAFVAARRQRMITGYRVTVVVLLAAILGLSIFKPAAVFKEAAPVAPAPITHAQADKVDRVASFLEDVGFNDPAYLGITPAVEGEYPTYRVTAIGGKTIDLWIRTTPNGGWEIQPVGVFKTVKSADDFARMANEAVYEWEHIPADIKPRTDGASGEWEGRKYLYDLLHQYNPEETYWAITPDETRGWPAK